MAGGTFRPLARCRGMRTFAGALVAIALAGLLATPAAASCRPPVSVAENATVAVVHGTVTDTNGGALTMRVDRIFKGQVGVGIRVFVGPGRTGVAATSVDYLAQAGSDHIFYLIRGADGQLETNACIGNHPGPANSDEIAYFGAGTTPSAASSPDPGGPAVAIPPFDFSPIWSAVVLAGAAVVASLVLWRHSPKLTR
jgi:hypothetical protein